MEEEVESRGGGEGEGRGREEECKILLWTSRLSLC